MLHHLTTYSILFGISCLFFFFFNDTATTEIYTLSLHDALPICGARLRHRADRGGPAAHCGPRARSEEHTSELQSQSNLVCRLLLEKKKKKKSKLAHNKVKTYNLHTTINHMTTLKSHMRIQLTLS